MSLVFETPRAAIEIDPEAVVIAGFTGRDRSEALAHIAELAELGVPTPQPIPSFYTAPGSAAVQQPLLQVSGLRTSGEAEVVLIFDGDSTFITLGSDHTDRDAEALDIALSKIVCPKPIACSAWALPEVSSRLDELELRSWILDDGKEVVYQQGRLDELMPFDDLLDAVPFAKRPDRFVMFTGTLPAIGGIRPSKRFRASLEDPAGGRSISLCYDVETLNVLSAPA